VGIAASHFARLLYTRKSFLLKFRAQIRTWNHEERND